MKIRTLSLLSQFWSSKQGSVATGERFKLHIKWWQLSFSHFFSDGITAAYTPHWLVRPWSMPSPRTLLCHASKSSFNLHSSLWLYHSLVNYFHFFLLILFFSLCVCTLNSRSFLHLYNLKVKCPLLKARPICPYSVKSFCGVGDETKRTDWICNVTGGNQFLITMH